MRKAGGIIALIAGIFGTIAALVTLMIGGIGKAFQAHQAEMVLWLGVGGLVFAFLTIILAAIAMNAAGRLPGMLLILSALAGAVLGGTLVAVCMVLTLAGGVLAVAGGAKTA